MSRIIIVIVVALGLLFSCDQTNKTSDKKAKYVFYFIGDGVSLPQLSLTEAYQAKINGKKGMQKLNQSKLDCHGWFYTFADNRFITGSAAAGTALATGHKTTINTIGKSSDQSKDLKSIAYKAKERGMKVGIMSTVSINHATPAAFYAHVNQREMYYEIGQQLFTSNFDLFAGGAIKYNMGEKKDKPDLYDTSGEIEIIRDNNKFLEASQEDLPLYFSHSRIQSEGAMPYAIDKQPGDLTLAEITKKAIELLDNDNGFFIMIEGGKIDWACHANDAATVIHEMIDYDNAIGEAIKFYNQHPDETLIIALGDHETGGLALGNETMHYKTHFDRLQNQKMSYEEAVNTVKQLIENKAPYTDAKEFLITNFGFWDKIKLSETDEKYLQKTWDESIQGKNTQVELTYGSGQKFVMLAMSVLNKYAGVGWTTYSHTGLPVVVHAQGVGAKEFDGVLDNTDIPGIIWKYIQ